MRNSKLETKRDGLVILDLAARIQRCQENRLGKYLGEEPRPKSEFEYRNLSGLRGRPNLIVSQKPPLVDLARRPSVTEFSR